MPPPKSRKGRQAFEGPLARAGSPPTSCDATPALSLQGRRRRPFPPASPCRLHFHPSTFGRCLLAQGLGFPAGDSPAPEQELVAYCHAGARQGGDLQAWPFLGGPPTCQVWMGLLGSNGTPYPMRRTTRPGIPDARAGAEGCPCPLQAPSAHLLRVYPTLPRLEDHLPTYRRAEETWRFQRGADRTELIGDMTALQGRWLFFRHYLYDGIIIWRCAIWHFPL